MSEEKLRVLQMLKDGKLNPTSALDLINALDEKETKETEPKLSTIATKERFLRVKVDSEESKVNVNIPLNLVKIATKFAGFGMNFIPASAQAEMAQKGIDLSKIDFEELLTLIDQGLTQGKLVDIDVNDQKSGPTKVEIYVD